MAWSFGDGFDCYAAVQDAYNGYWDAGTASISISIVAGRFSGSRALSWNGVGTGALVKTSGVNDAVHHIVVAYQQIAAISGSTLGVYLQLFDGATSQCSIVFRSDGAILLTSGAPNGTVLDTYTGAVTANNTWYAFEFEIVINNTIGSWAVRKNGNTSNDRALGSLNTRPTSVNNYANKLQVHSQATVNSAIDDLFWRCDASSVAWMGDIRCYTRMPASDASVQFSRTPTSNTQAPFVANNTTPLVSGRAQYTPFTAAYDGTISAATVSFGTGYTGNLKCSIFASSGTAPTTVLGSATVVVNPATGVNAITFGTPVAVSKGGQYWIGFASDTASGTWSTQNGSTAGALSATAYASFPVATPSVTTAVVPVICSVTITVSTNNSVVNEPQQDTTTSYVYDSTAGHADFYGISALSPTPATVVAVTTRGYMQKSDAGSRTAAVQLKSGGTTVAAPTLTLTTSGWLWAWRTDTTNPATSGTWTNTAVDAVTVGPVVIS